MEYCCHIWAGASACHLFLLDRVQKRIVNLIGDELGSSLQSLSHRRSIATLSLFYIMVNVPPVCPTLFLLLGCLSVKIGFPPVLTHTP